MRQFYSNSSLKLKLSSLIDSLALSNLAIPQTPSTPSAAQTRLSAALLHRQEQLPRSEQRHELLVAVSTFAVRQGRPGFKADDRGEEGQSVAFLQFSKRSPRTPPAAPAGTSSSALASSVLVISNPVNGDDDDLPPPS